MNDTKEQAAPNSSKINPTVTIVLDGDRVGFKHNLTNLDMVLEVVFQGLKAVLNQRVAAGEEQEENKIVIPTLVPPKMGGG